MSLCISEGDVSLLFPAHLRLDLAMRVTRIGPALVRAFPTLQLGDRLRDTFAVPQVSTADDLVRIAGACGMVTLRPHRKNFMLAGSVVAEPHGFFLALHFQPSLDVADRHELRIEDFSPGDPLVPGMMLIRLQKGLLDEARHSARELDQERQRSVELTERISRISSYAVHDFNNLLSIVALNVNLLRKYGGLADRQLQYLGVIEETIARGSDVTRALLALAHRHDSSRSVHLVDRLLTEDKTFLQAMAGSKVELAFDLAAEGVSIDVSRIWLSQCLLNLVINAREAMSEGGRVTVSSRIVPRPADLGPAESGAPESGADAEQWVAIAVSDTGPGMAPGDAAHAFERFFSTKQRGSGLGLASVQDFVTEHGGGGQPGHRPRTGSDGGAAAARRRVAGDRRADARNCPASRALPAGADRGRRTLRA